MPPPEEVVDPPPVDEASFDLSQIDVMCKWRVFASRLQVFGCDETTQMRPASNQQRKTDLVQISKINRHIIVGQRHNISFI